MPLPPIRYVITLDADSLLTRGGARRLIATLAHPLNQAAFDPQTGALIAGYTVLQPRVRVKPTSVNRSILTRLFAGDRGLDLYTQAISDVYQDLFQEGIFVGKGIMDVAAFHRSLEGRVPENALLSHDLFEGIVGRAGLVADVVVLENYPDHYLASTERQHRWMRGDWQLLPWLLPWVPAETGGTIPNDFSSLDRWKILDNLRRSLLAPSLLALLIAGWLWLPGPALFWTGVAVLTPGASILAGIALGFRLRWPALPSLEQLRPLWMDLARWALALVLLPFEALLALDAIGVTLARLLLTRRRLLEWTPAAQISRALGKRPSRGLTWRRMISAPIVALAAALIAGAPPAFVAGARRAAAGRLADLASDGAVDQPPDPPPATAPDTGAAAAAGRDRPPHVAVLRALRRAGGPLAAAGSFPGIALAARSPITPHPPTSASCCSRGWPPAIWAMSACSGWRCG